MPEAAPVQATSATHPVDLVGLATEVVAAYVAHNSVPVADLPGLIAAVHETLVGLGRPGPAVVAEARPTPPVPVKRSIGDDFLVSLEDGKRYKSLKRHLSKHGLTPAEYRAKWGLPGDYPMVAPSYAAKRSALAKSMGLGQQRRKPAAS